jgi:dipeptidyl-peptidase-4
VNVVPYTAQTMLPAIRERMRAREGFEVTDYGDFSRTGVARGQRAAGRGGPPDTSAAARGRRGGGGFAGPRGPSLEQIIADSIPTSGWAFSTYESLARYGTNYYGLRNRIGILSEAFSHDPFARRVASTYDFVSEILSYLAEHKTEIMNLGKQGDAKVASWAKNPGSSPPLALKSRMDTTRMEDVRVEVIVPLTDSTKREPGMGARQRTGVIKLVRMPVMASFAPTLTSTLPFAYAFDAKAAKDILPVLKMHGIGVEQLDAPVSASVQSFKVDTVIDRGRSETSRMLKDLDGAWSDAAVHSLPAGTYIVRAGQPYGLLAFYLLEPQSEDGLAQWSFFNDILAPHSEFPISRVTKRMTARSHAVRD